MSDLKLRNIQFNLSSGQSYSFVMNETVSLKSVRKMIVAAANLSTKNISLIKDNEDLTEKENMTLLELFPDSKSLDFKIKESMKPENHSVKLKQGVSCHNHKYKYPYFYCYDCKISICYLCVQSQEHLNHNLIDKHDFAQDTGHIVNHLFKELDSVINGLSTDKIKDIENYKDKINKEIFPRVFERIQQLQAKILGVMDLLVERIRTGKSTIESNVVDLKNFTFQGIEDLKQKLHIEDLMVNEEVFLAFDEKMREISEEKKKIFSATKTYEELLENVDYLTNNIGGAYVQVEEITEKTLNSDIYQNLSNRFKDKVIDHITQEEVYKILFSEIEKKRKEKFTEPNVENPDFLNGLFENKNKGIFANLFHLLRGGALGTPQDLKNHLFGIKDLREVKEKVKNINGSGNKKIWIENSEDNIYYCKIDSKEVYYYNQISDDIRGKEVISNELSAFKKFLKGSSWVNSKGNLFITGGLNDDSTPSNSAFLYQGQTNTIVLLPTMITARANHSSYLSEDFLYVSGGTSVNTIEAFDIKNYKWINLGTLSVQRENPLLYLLNNRYLYNFFGTNGGVLLDSVERIDLNGQGNNKKGELVKYKPSESNLVVCNAGFIELKNSRVLIIGGKTKNGFNSGALLHFDFEKLEFAEIKQDIQDNVTFLEGRLHKLKDNHYSNFNSENQQFFKIEIELDE